MANPTVTYTGQLLGGVHTGWQAFIYFRADHGSYMEFRVPGSQFMQLQIDAYEKGKPSGHVTLQVEPNARFMLFQRWDTVRSWTPAIGPES